MRRSLYALGFFLFGLPGVRADDRGLGCAPFEIVARPLHTDFLRRASATLSLKILRQSERDRLILIRGTEGQTLTRAYSTFSWPIPEPIRGAHQKIIAGELMGETFRREGWTVTKEPLVTATLPLDRKVARALGVAPDPRQRIPFRIYTFWVQRGDPPQKFRYANVLEIDRQAFREEEAFQSDDWTGTATEVMLREALK